MHCFRVWTAHGSGNTARREELGERAMDNGAVKITLFAYGPKVECSGWLDGPTWATYARLHRDENDRNRAMSA